MADSRLADLPTALGRSSAGAVPTGPRRARRESVPDLRIVHDGPDPRASLRRPALASALTAALALSLVAAVSLSGFADATAIAVNDWLCAAGLLLMAGLLLSAPLQSRRVSWAGFALGGWLICSSFILPVPVEVSPTPVWTNIVAGSLTITLAAAVTVAHDRQSGR